MPKPDPTYGEYPAEQEGTHNALCRLWAEELRTLVGSQLPDSALPGRLRAGEAIQLFSTPRTRNDQYLRPAARRHQLSRCPAAARTG